MDGGIEKPPNEKDSGAGTPEPLGQNQGVHPSTALLALVQAPARIVAYSSDGSFQFSPDGREAIVLPVHLDGGEVWDHVAWFAPEPACWWLERNVASHLGDRELLSCALLGRSVRLLATPQDWMDDLNLAGC
jgi:hypothetical protein